MRALSTLLVVCLALVAVVLLAPAAAASAGAAAGAAVGGAVVPAAGLVAAAAGAGIVVQLRANRYDDQGARTNAQTFRLDSDADNFPDELQAYGDAKQEEGAAPVRAQLAATETDRDAFRTVMVDEVLRVQQLTAGEGADFDADEERAYLESLRPATLKLHFKKAREKTVALKTQTTGEEPGDVVDESAFGNVSVS